MSLTQIVDAFGVDSIAFYNRLSGIYYGRLRVLQGSSLVLSSKLVELKGGSSKFSWDAQEGSMDAKLQLKGREYPNFLMQLFGGGTPIDIASDATDPSAGTTYCSKPVNVYQTSLRGLYWDEGSGTGIQTLAVTTDTSKQPNVKFGRFVAKSISADQIRVYFSTDIDFARGTDGSYLSDALEITGSPFTLISAEYISIPEFGLRISGDAAGLAMTAGETCTWVTKPITSASTETTLGTQVATFPEWGAIMMAKRKSTGELIEAEIFRGKGQGVPLKFEEDKFSDWDINCAVLQDPNQDGLVRIRRVTPLSAT